MTDYKIETGEKTVLKDEFSVSKDNADRYTVRVSITRNDTGESLIDQDCDAVLISAHKAGEESGRIIGASIVTGASPDVVLGMIAGTFTALAKLSNDKVLPFIAFKRAAENSGFSLGEKSGGVLSSIKNAFKFWD